MVITSTSLLNLKRWDFCNGEDSSKLCINLDTTSNARLFPNMTGSILSEWRCDVKPFYCICMLGPVTPACSNSTEGALVKKKWHL
ncbi:unnamed protein product [Ixodes pacificus]